MAIIWPRAPLAMSAMVRRVMMSVLMTSKMTSAPVIAMIPSVPRRCPIDVPLESRRCLVGVPSGSRRCPAGVPSVSRRCPVGVPWVSRGVPW